MTIEEQLTELRLYLAKKFYGATLETTPLKHGYTLVSIHNLRLPEGWNRDTSTIHFRISPSYPYELPESMWAEPGMLRLHNGRHAYNTNDGNRIPSDPNPSRSTTWFRLSPRAWRWDTDRLFQYFHIVLHRLQSPEAGLAEAYGWRD